MFGFGITSDIKPFDQNPYPIVDNEWPCFIAGIETANFPRSLNNVKFILLPLDCDRFLHGEGQYCSKSPWIIGVWKVFLQHCNGVCVRIPFYITTKDGLMLLVNEIFHISDQCGEQNIIRIQVGAAKLSQTELFLRTYTEKRDVDNYNFRTYISVVPAKMCLLRFFLTTTGSRGETHSQKFAIKLHGYNHLSVEDMTFLLQRQGSTNPRANDDTESCSWQTLFVKGIKKTKNTKKFPFSRLLLDFKKHLLLYHFHIPSLTSGSVMLVDNTKSNYSKSGMIPNHSKDKFLDTSRWFG